MENVGSQGLREPTMHMRCLMKWKGDLGMFVEYGNWQDDASLHARRNNRPGLGK